MIASSGWASNLRVWWARWGLFVKIGFLLWLILAMLGPSLQLLAEEQLTLDLPMMLSGVAIALAAFGLAGARWAMVSRALKAPIPFGFALRFNFVGLFFYCVTPFGIGMDVLKVMKSVDAVSAITTRMAILQVMVDRLIGLACLMTGFAAVAALVFPDVLLTPILGYLVARPLAAAAAALACAVCAGMALWFGPSWISRRTGTEFRLADLVRMALGFDMLVAAALSLASQFLHILAIVVMLWAVGRTGNYWAIACASFGSMVFFFIPISVFGVGAPQLAAAAILVALGSSTRDAALVILLSYATILAGGLVGGALEILRDLKDRFQAKPSAPP